MRRLLPSLSVAACLVAAGPGCAARTRGPDTRAPAWDDGTLTGEAAAAQGPALSAMAKARTPGPRLARLDRLLDLLDAARFSGDAGAREALWSALDGHAISRGHDATREAQNRLLQEAWAIEDAHAELGEDAGRFLADAIMLLSVDLNRPADAEALSIQALAYRTLASEGHPRVADNAHWRLYDHLRGVLEGAVAAPAERRVEIAAHALYAENDDIEPWLSDLAPHARPTPPPPRVLWDLVERQLAPLRADARWREVVEGRSERDAGLRETVLARLPEARDPTWVLADVARGTGVPESLAPVLLLEPGRARVEPGRADAKAMSAIDPELSRALERVVARDGRGTLLLAGDPVLPSPELAGALDAIARARVALVEVAVREPRVDDPSRHVVVALPLQVSRPDDRGAGARAFQEARVRVHLDGRGPRFAIDGAWLSHAPTSATQLDALVREIARAYPRERAVALTMAGNVLHQQLLEVLIGLEGGEPRAFEAVGWLVGAGEPAPAKGTADATLAARTRLHVDPTRAPELVQAFPLARADQSRVEQLARTLGECVPELEATPPRDGVRVDLQFREGRLAELVVGDRVPKARRSALEACARDVAFGFRLREHRDAITVGVVLRADH